MSDREWQAKMGDMDFNRKDYQKLKSGDPNKATWNQETNQFDFTQ